MGAAMMYVFDSDRGNRRRAMMRDQTIKAGHIISDAANTTARDARNRGIGLVREMGSWFTDRPADDDAVLSRVRSNLGMLVRHPRSIKVSVSQGRVTLEGPILEDEVEEALRVISRVPGVHEVTNRFDVHRGADGIPGLQGQADQPPRRPRFELMQVNWSPTARFLTALTGSVLAVVGLRRHSLGGTGMAAVGACFLTRGLTNKEVSRLFQRKKSQE